MYNNYGFNPYYPQQQRLVTNNEQINQQPMMPTYQTPMQMNKIGGLLGKEVDSIEVVKAMDIPLDGSVSFFPLMDRSAIVTKQLQNDGTSKMVIYKPVEEERKETIAYATLEDIQEAIGELDLSDIQDLKDDIKEIKRQLKEMKIKKGKDE